MELRITNVYNQKDTINDECVRISVLKDTNLVSFAIIDNSYDELTGLSNIHRHFYKFPSQNVKTNDIIRVYTGNGKQSVGKTSDGKNNIYYYYCGSGDFIWNNTGDTARIIKISEVSKFEVTPTK